MEKFMTLLSKLEPIEFAAVAQLLKVKLYNDSKEPKVFSSVLEEILHQYSELSRKKRRELLKIMKHAIKERKYDTNNTED